MPLSFTEKESEVAQPCPTLCVPMDCMQPTRLLRPWDFPGKSTGVGCHSLLGDLPNPGVKSRSPTLQAGHFTFWTSKEVSLKILSKSTEAAPESNARDLDHHGSLISPGLFLHYKSEHFRQDDPRQQGTNHKTKTPSRITYRHIFWLKICH